MAAILINLWIYLCICTLIISDLSSLTRTKLKGTSFKIDAVEKLLTFLIAFVSLVYVQGPL